MIRSPSGAKIRCGDRRADGDDTIVFGVPDTEGVISITGGVAGQVAFVNAFSLDFQSFSPLFADPAFTTEGFSATGTGYAMLKLRSGQIGALRLKEASMGMAEIFERRDDLLAAERFHPCTSHQRRPGRRRPYRLGARVRGRR